ncbi:MAG TPA: nickel pincer cofactor biosynthesis protein LarB [Syntrophorhabdales bacterium]|nr:nickel pincer cofactor biosynthesis protein LarB [Syntrophorhabdales bacterium]
MRKLLNGVRKGTVALDVAVEQLKELPFQDLVHTKIDHHRTLRKGMEEVLFGEGKSLQHMAETIRSMRKKGSDILVTRIAKDVGSKLKKLFPEGMYNEAGKCFVIKKGRAVKGKGMILIISAGTSDIPVAEEAYATCTFFGNEAEKLYDVGVAGIHRLFQSMPLLRKARVVIVAAGMEGALPSIVAGIVGAPVIAIPTSIGYGASFGGLSALLTMLNSCSTVATFNIDNGFGAAYFATLINRL